MKTSTTRRRRDSYLDLVMKFPLRPIRTDVECDAAAKVMDRLAIRDDLDSGEEDYLQVLTTLVEQYEEIHHPVPDTASALEVLKQLMLARGMSTADLGRVLGHSSLASAILSGKRQISKANARLLARHFGHDVGLFVDG